MSGDPPAPGHALAAIVVGLAPDHARAFCAAIASERQFSEDAAARAVRAIASPGYRQVAGDLVAWWRQRPSMSGACVALAVEACAATRAIERAEEVLDAVVTGPSSVHVAVRQTRAVVLELIERAERDLLIVSFAAYKVAQVVDALRAATTRGVRCRLVLETAEDSAGRLSQDAGEAFASLGSRAEFYVWPLDQRPAGASAALHAKGLIADAQVAFITSANLTGAALDHNLEIGVLVRGGTVPRRLHDHFLALVGSGVLRRVCRW